MARGDASQAAGGWAELAAPANRRSVLVAVLVLMMQVGTGIDFVTVYAPKLMQEIANSTVCNGGSKLGP